MQALISVPAMQWQSTYWVPPYFIIIIIIIFSQISVRKNCRTVCTTPAIYTSKRAARPGSVCYYFFCRYALRWRRDSQKNNVKKPHWLSMGENRKKPKLCRHIPRAYFCRGTCTKIQSGHETVDVFLVQTVFDFVLRLCHSRRRQPVCFALFLAGNPLLECRLEWER